MISESSSYVLCPEAIDDEDRPTVTAFDAFESQLKTLCLKEFPCGLGSWVRQSRYTSSTTVVRVFTSYYNTFWQ